MKIITIDNIKCYYMNDIEKELGDKQWEEFCEWFVGQTGLYHKGRILVYKDDFERFVEDRPIID